MEDPPVEHPPTVTLTFQVQMSVAHEKSQALREGGCGGLFQQTHSLNDDAVFLFYLARSAEIDGWGRLRTSMNVFEVVWGCLQTYVRCVQIPFVEQVLPHATLYRQTEGLVKPAFMSVGDISRMLTTTGILEGLSRRSRMLFKPMKGGRGSNCSTLWQSKLINSPGPRR